MTAIGQPHGFFFTTFSTPLETRSSTISQVSGEGLVSARGREAAGGRCWSRKRVIAGEGIARP